MIILLSTFFMTFITAKPVVKVGAINLPPFFVFNHKTKKVSGSAVNEVKKILEESYQLKWEEIPLARGKYALKEGMIDVYTGYVKAEAYKGLAFSEDKYFTIEPFACGKLLENREFISLSEAPINFLKGRTLIFPEGSRSEFPFFKEKKLKVIRRAYNKEYIKTSLEMVDLKRADFFSVPSMLGVEEIKGYPCISMDGKKMDVHFSFEKGSPWKQKIDDLMKSKQGLNSNKE